MPTIDLILATAGRTREPARFLRALAAQTFRDFRLLVVDQNGDDRLAPILTEYAQTMAILHLRSDLGNSHARNVGLRHVSAEIVGFPDDDCWYPPGLLEQVVGSFTARPEYHGVSGRSIDERGRPSGGRWDGEAGAITPFNVWKRTGAYTVFLDAPVIAATGAFDEELGLGPQATWPAAEDIDYVLRAVKEGFAVYYDPALRVHHGQTREGALRPEPEAGHRYGLGAGRVLRKNRLPWWFAAYYCARSFAAAGLSLIGGNRSGARFYWAVGRGRVRGWRSARTSS